MVFWHFIAGHIGWPLLALSAGDLFYAAAFLVLLRNAGQSGAQGAMQ